MPGRAVHLLTSLRASNLLLLPSREYYHGNMYRAVSPHWVHLVGQCLLRVCSAQTRHTQVDSFGTVHNKCQLAECKLIAEWTAPGSPLGPLGQSQQSRECTNRCARLDLQSPTFVSHADNNASGH